MDDDDDDDEDEDNDDDDVYKSSKSTLHELCWVYGADQIFLSI